MYKEIEILIVEDNPGDAELTIRALKRRKLANHIIHLEDGAEALNFIFGNGDADISHVPRLVLLDLKMPKVSGLEVLQKIKEDPRTRHIPVVILTSSSEDPDVKRSYELGANSYIVKPVEFDKFSQTVADLGFYWMAINKV